LNAIIGYMLMQKLYESVLGKPKKLALFWQYVTCNMVVTSFFGLMLLVVWATETVSEVMLCYSVYFCIGLIWSNSGKTD